MTKFVEWLNKLLLFFRYYFFIMTEIKNHVLSGFLSASISTLTLHPLDLIKVRFQLNQQHSESTLNALKFIFNKQGNYS